MYEYMVKAEVLSETAPFKVLNCAQYYNNPELLSGLLFGYSKGAFTGAYEKKRGLLEDANGGLLFLDEVHRLNAEGQEKLLLSWIKGPFLGSVNQPSEKQLSDWPSRQLRKPPLLQTFLRRIPITIYLPNLSERSILEKRNYREALSS